MLAHQFADQVFFAGNTHFVGGIKLNAQHSLNGRLYHGCDFRTLYMLSQQHTEHWRDRRVFACGFNKVHARRTGRNRNQQTACAALTARLYYDFIPVRLIDFFYAAACQCGIQFIGHCPKADGI